MRNFALSPTRAMCTAVLLCLVATAAQAMTLPDFTGLVEQNSPAVVNISTTQKVKAPHPGSQDRPDLPQGTPFDDFFRRFFGDPDEGDAPDFDAKSLGSGFIISPDGFILTNSHVIDDADKIVVRLSDRREFEAKVIGSDKRSDVALLKIDASGLPVVKIGDSDKLKPGEWVLAIGSPFGFDHSVTAGIVSAKGRNLPSENYVPFIQTDVAINPGNSGGPLFNMDGDVVGINSQIYSRTGGFMGLSFAIPINVTMNVVDQLKSKGYVSRGWLGILIQDVTQELAESFNMKKPAGALVARVLPDSPAEKAGIKVGDIITEFKGREVVSSSNLPPMVGNTEVGSTADIKVIRDGKSMTLHVKIAELPKEEDIKLASKGDGKEGEAQSVAEQRLGVTVSPLTAAQRKDLDIKEAGGVLVTAVDDGPASQAGIRRGDIILKINSVDVKDVKHFNKLVGDLPQDKSVPVLVQREEGPLFLALKLDDAE
jgi:serine protease Do